jgi:outer membrane receptor protein involved in Fe transport
LSSILILQSAGLVSGQQAPAPVATDDEEPVVLSPFTVDASQDRGYRATSTLAGSRINTNLRDVAASITEVTPEFLSDVAAVDINDVLAYMANTESTFNYTSAPSQGIGGFADNVATNPQTANRVRGMSSATLTRDYFITIGDDIGFDSYNVDRITINRGPNSILFGLGDPSGVVNFTPKVAKPNRNSNELSFRYGSHDDMRATADFNRVLIPDKLALRVAGLWSDRGFKQQPSYYRDDRVNVMATYKPFEKTTLQASFEKTKLRANSPNAITPLDQITKWIEQGRPTWDPSTQQWDDRPENFASLTGGGFVGPTRPDGSLEYTYQEGAGQATRATFWAPNTPGVLVYNSIGVSDSRYVPLHTMNLLPSVRNADMDVFTASWDQQITTDLYFNVAYLNEQLDNESFSWTRTNQYGVFVDVNTHLPDGRQNPHFGETFMPQRSLDSRGVTENQNEAVRGTLNYNLDLTRQANWTRWIGRHVFTGYAERRESDFVFDGYNGTRTGTPSYLNAADRINNEGWQITRLRYLGGTAEKAATAAPGVPKTGESGIPNRYYTGTTGMWESDTFGEFFALKRRDLGTNLVKSRAGVWQGYLLSDRIVGTVGLRHDENTVASKASTSIDPATGLLRVDDTLGDPNTVSGNTKTYGVVAHPFKWLSLHYNRSENFVALAGDVNVYGESIAPPSGKGKDYGFSLDLMEGDLNVRVNWYEVAQTNSRTTNSGPDILAQWELAWFDQVVIPRLAEQYGLTHDTFFSPIGWGDNRIEETADVVSKGVEVEVVYNPTANWRIMANVSKQKASRSNIAPGLTRWIEETLPTWQAAPWFNGPETYDAGWGVDGNLATYFSSFNTGRVLATYKSEEGLTSPELREWHINVINNYEFTEGRLKGWNVGGALRWESEAAIGYPGITENGLLVGLDLANAYTDDAQLNVDLWTGYTRRIWNDRIKWNIQLNVRNVTQSEGLQPILANSDGTPAQFRIEFGPTWYLTSTFNF